MLVKINKVDHKKKTNAKIYLVRFLFWAFHKKFM